MYERELLREFLVENKPPAFIRKQNKDLVDSGKRTFKIKSRDGKRIIENVIIHYANGKITRQVARRSLGLTAAASRAAHRL